MSSKKGAADIGSGLVWIVVIIIVFFGAMIFLLAVIFTPKSSAIDIYKKTSDAGIAQYNILNAIMKSKSDGKTFEQEIKDIYSSDYSKINADEKLARNIQASDFDNKILNLLSKRGSGCYMFLVNTDNAFEEKASRGAFSVGNKLVIREVFYFLKNGKIWHLTSSSYSLDSNFNNPNPSQAVANGAYIEIKDKPVHFYISQCGENVN